MANGMRLDSEQLREMPLHIQEQVAMHFIPSDKVILSEEGTPAQAIAPGHSNYYNLAEMAFHNGEAHRSEQILAILMDRKSKAKGEVHKELVELIEIVRELKY